MERGCIECVDRKSTVDYAGQVAARIIKRGDVEREAGSVQDSVEIEIQREGKLAVIVPFLRDMPSRIGLRCCNVGGRGSDAVLPQSAAGAPPIAGKRLFRIEMNVLATEFSSIGIGGGIRRQTTETVFIGVDGARVGTLSES